jgi:hypothetical protein
VQSVDGVHWISFRSAGRLPLLHGWYTSVSGDAGESGGGSVTGRVSQKGLWTTCLQAPGHGVVTRATASGNTRVKSRSGSSRAGSISCSAFRRRLGSGFGRQPRRERDEAGQDGPNRLRVSIGEEPHELPSGSDGWTPSSRGAATLDGRRPTGPSLLGRQAIPPGRFPSEAWSPGPAARHPGKGPRANGLSGDPGLGPRPRR